MIFFFGNNERLSPDLINKREKKNKLPRHLNKIPPFGKLSE